jgi:hypothetical protein
MTPTQAILQSARIAELKAHADVLAALARPAPVIAIRSSSRRSDDHRRLLLLLAQERRRSTRLIAELAR